MPHRRSQAANGRRSVSILIVLCSVLWLGAAAAQESSRGPLFPRSSGETGTNPGIGTTYRAPGTAGQPGALQGGVPGVSDPFSSLGGAALPAVPQARQPATTEPRSVPEDPLRGLILRSEPSGGRPRETSTPDGRTANTGERVRQPGATDNRTQAPATGAPTDPLGGLLSDSEKLLRFSGPKPDATAPDSKSKSAEELPTSRQSRNVIATPGIAVPEIAIGGSGMLTMPAVPSTLVPNATNDATMLELGSPTVSGPETGTGTGQKPHSMNLSGGAAADPPARRLVQQFTLYERIQQLVLATLRQPLSYVLLLGAVGFFVAIKLRRA